ncbi:MAG: transglutaminase N-terminal domain-containing protein, partial [Flavobacteriaceae bacterium]
MVYQLSHTTSYKYQSGVTFCHNIATIRPKNLVGQTVLEYELEISPEPTEISEKTDFFGNTITRFSIQKFHKKLIVTAKSKVLRDNTLQPDIYTSEIVKSITLDDALLEMKSINPEILEVKQYVLESILIANISSEIEAYAKVSFQPNRPIFEATFELMQRIFKDFEFNADVTNVATPIHEVMKNKKGVCQDFAQIGIACLRSVGIPARYVSGYIET